MASTNPTDVRLLKPSAREVFALRPRSIKTRDHKHFGPSEVTTADPWPEGMTQEDLQGALVRSGFRR